jgi:TfdA family taurine catabolism dioxygenase TauD
MSEELPVHTPPSIPNRVTVLTLPPRLGEHVSWLEKTFPAEAYDLPERQRTARRALEQRVDGLAPVLAQTASAVRGEQAVVLRGLPTESTAMVVAVASAAVPVVRAHPAGPLVDDLKPKPDPDELTRFADRRDGLTPHTDSSAMPNPPAVLALAFVHNTDPDGGGESTLAHIDDVAAALDGTDIELLRALRYPVLDPPTDTNRTPTLISILDRRADGRLTARYWDVILDAGIASPLAPEVPSAPHLGALRQFTAAVCDPAVQTRVRLDSGDMLILDNTRFLHGRTPISPDVRRHLKRLFLKHGSA